VERSRQRSLLLSSIIVTPGRPGDTVAAIEAARDNPARQLRGILTLMFPKVDEFERILLASPLEGIVENQILQGEPFAFRQDPEALNLLRRHLATELGIQPEQAIVVGSARVGFSLNPDNYPRPFAPDSDIDVAVIDEAIFDSAWHTLLAWNYPRRLSKLGRPDGDWAYQRRKDVFWGWFTPDEIRYDGISFPDALEPLRDLSARWFDAFRAFSQYVDHPEIARREVRGRLYRTSTHLFKYHWEGLRLIKRIVELKRAG
jgi:hypothetical protein